MYWYTSSSALAWYPRNRSTAARLVASHPLGSSGYWHSSSTSSETPSLTASTGFVWAGRLRRRRICSTLGPSAARKTHSTAASRRHSTRFATRKNTPVRLL